MKFVIFHGTYSRSNEYWFVGLKNELEKHGQEVLLPEFPTDDWDETTALGEEFARTRKDQKQTLSNWLAHFENAVVPWINGDSNTVFIGHSLGCVFILHAVLTYRISLKHAIFVSPFYEDLATTGTPWQLDIENKTFYKNDFDASILRKYIPQSYSLYSGNDPYVLKNEAVEFAELLGSSFIEIENAKHLSRMFKRLPIVEELCKTFVDYSGMTDSEYIAK